MTRSKKNFINKDRTKDININHRTRKLVKCNCILHCHSSKWVDPKTFKRYQQEIDQFCAITSGSQDSSQLKSIKSKPVDNIECESVLTKEDSKEDSEEDFNVMIDKDSTEDNS
ncbi:14585_t:CDS:2 [Funneliformis mosseae]|uniref:14585_t:CDS:1 n=1 Tax=Funneliformis mosseae TaxID=27381 RepID=A0A9N9N2M8_FUNMO|nr:14585_t:CDS:2 [Funneliformis mosseae]